MGQSTHGRIATMKTTIDAAGRLVIPKRVREEARLEPGMVLEVRCHEGRVEIEPAPVPIRLVRKGHLLVAVAEAGGEPLTVEMVERIRQEVRDERLQLP